MFYMPLTSLFSPTVVQQWPKHVGDNKYVMLVVYSNLQYVHFVGLVKKFLPNF